MTQLPADADALTMAVVPPSDADVLTPEDIAANAADADAIRAELTNIAKSRFVIARRLREVKKRLGHGKFLRWLEHENLWRWCDRQARIDMQIVRAFGSESDSDLNLIGPTALKALSAPTVPPEARAEAFKETLGAAKKSGRKGAVATAKAAVAKHKTVSAPEPAKATPVEAAIAEPVEAEPKTTAPAETTTAEHNKSATSNRKKAMPSEVTLTPEPMARKITTEQFRERFPVLLKQLEAMTHKPPDSWEGVVNSVRNYIAEFAVLFSKWEM